MCNERLHGCRKFVFARGTLISSQPDVTFPYGGGRACERDDGAAAGRRRDRDVALLIKNPKERGPMFKMREPRKYIRIYERQRNKTCLPPRRELS